MSYESVASDVVKVIEGVGGGIMVIGGLVAFTRFAQQVAGDASDRSESCARTSDE